MISLNQFSINKVEEKDNEAIFEIGPLPKGYGNTLGTFLRRVLLSSIPGSAITAVKLDNILHEYSTLEGLSDDALSIVLSLKNVILVSSSLKPVTVDLNISGKKGKVVNVKASDIKETSDVKVINKDYVITKLTKDNNAFSAQLTVQRGVGYLPPNEELRKEIGLLPLDARFSPVKLVSYEIADTRVGKETELDLLKLTIKTNGAVSPEEALFVASDILDQTTTHLAKITNNLLKGDEVSLVVSEKEKDEKAKMPDEQKPKRVEPLKILDLNLSTRLTNALLRSNYEDLRSLDGMTEEEIMSIRGMGHKSFSELTSVLKKYNIKLL